MFVLHNHGATRGKARVVVFFLGRPNLSTLRLSLQLEDKLNLICRAYQC